MFSTRFPAVRKLAASLLAASLLALPVGGQDFDSAAPFAYIKDIGANIVLFQRGQDEPMPPASMAKMMTVLVAFDLVDHGKLKLSDKCTVRPDTWTQWQNQGSTMFLEVNETVTVEQLLDGIVTLSGNDASVVLAECIAGTESAFAKAMNSMGKEIGLTGSNFETANGWPHENEHVTAHDLARIAEETIENHRKLYDRFYTIPEVTRNLSSGETITQQNRNPVLGRVQGADGLKTGHTEAAGYGFTGSAERDGRRIVMVVAGLTSQAQRRDESTRMLEWAFNAYEGATLEPGRVIAEADVHNGEAMKVGLKAADGSYLLLPKAVVSDVTAKVVYKGPIEAPIKENQRVGYLVVQAADLPEQRVPLVAAQEVDEAGFFTKAINGFSSLLN